VLLNVNFPPLPASKVKRVAVTTQGQRDQSMLRLEERQDARGRTYFWIGFKRVFQDPDKGTDLRAIYDGQISVTPLHLDLTELREQKRLSELMDGNLSGLARVSRKPSKARPPKGRNRRSERIVER
jgi:5'-nucleotidase